MNEAGGAHRILGVARDAGPAQIRAAYRRRAMRIHPDRGGDPAAFDALATAYNQLLSGSEPAAVRLEPQPQTEPAAWADVEDRAAPAYVIAAYVGLVVAAILGLRALVAFDIDAVIAAFQLAFATAAFSLVAVWYWRHRRVPARR